MSELFKPMLELLKLAPRYLVALGLVLGVIILAPDELAQRLGIAHLAQDYRPAIGVGFLLCVSLLLVSVAGWAGRIVGDLFATRKFKRQLQQRLARLTEDEKQILRYYISQQTRANTLRIDDGTVKALVGSHVIFRSANTGNMTEGFAHNINEIAWDMLQENPALLQGTTNVYRTDKRYRGS